MDQNTESTKCKVLVAMSGGVDSSAAAHLILNQGYDAIGSTMRLTDGLPLNDFNDSDIMGAKETCQKLGIDHTVLDLRA